MIAYNSQKKIIYKNKNVRKLKSSLSTATGLNHQTVTDYFPDAFFNLFGTGEPGKVYTMRAGDAAYKYRVQSVDMSKGLVYLITFVSSNDNSI